MKENIFEKSKPRILMLCSHNSVRSQLAEAVFRYLGKGKIEVKSAGINPCGVNPYVYKVLEEVGISSGGLYSKSVTEFINRKFDYVITVCDRADKSCPVFSGKYRKIHYPLSDPGEAQDQEIDALSAFRNTRNIIKALAIEFLGLELKKANLKCPFCGVIQEIDIPQDRRFAFYKCPHCQKRISPSKESCCVICGFSDKICPEFYKQTIEKFLREEA